MWISKLFIVIIFCHFLNNACFGLYMNPDSFAKAYNKAYLKQFPNAPKKIHQMFPQYHGNYIFKLSRVTQAWIHFKIQQTLQLYFFIQEEEKLDILPWEQRRALKKLIEKFYGSNWGNIKLKFKFGDTVETSTIPYPPFSPFGGKWEIAFLFVLWHDIVTSLHPTKSGTLLKPSQFSFFRSLSTIE